MSKHRDVTRGSAAIEASVLLFGASAGAMVALFCAWAKTGPFAPLWFAFLCFVAAIYCDYFARRTRARWGGGPGGDQDCGEG